MKNKVLYITYNEPVNGLYESQVIDVLKFWKEELGVNVKLLAFFSIRDFFSQRKKFKDKFPDSFSLPSFPKLQFIGLNSYLYFLIANLKYKGYTCICRNAFAGTIGYSWRRMSVFKRFIYDARGLLKAEALEYDVYPKHLIDFVIQKEKLCVTNCDELMVITSGMTEYYQRHYQLELNKPIHEIPCTLSSEHLKEPNQSIIIEVEKKINKSADDIVLIYSGSTAGWQSFPKLCEWVDKMMESDSRIKTIFLCIKTLEVEKLEDKFLGRFFNFFVAPTEIRSYLEVADYGLLLREASETNKVSAPTKYAEYLNAGLRVISNKNLFLYEEIMQNELGTILNNFEVVTIPNSSNPQRKRNQKFAESKFRKTALSIKGKYQKLLLA